MAKPALRTTLVGIVCSCILGHVTSTTADAQAITTESALRSAIISANSDGVDTTIYVAGTIGLTSMGTGEDASASGDLDVTEVGTRLTIVGQGPTSTTIRSQYWFSDRLVHVHAGAKLTIQGVYLKAEKSVGATVLGDTVFNDGGDLVLADCTLFGTTSGTPAGGVYNTGTATITDSLIQRNTIDGGVVNTGDLYVEGTTFDSNSDGTFYGGGIRNLAGTVDCLECTFLENAAASGGSGIYTDGGVVDLEDCVFDSNSGGGAVWNKNGEVYAYVCLFNENGGPIGGAVVSSPQNGGTSYFEFDACDFTYNTSHAGGAFHVLAPASSPASSSIIYLSGSCVIEYNEASQDGGGIFASGQNAYVDLGNTLVRYNEAGCSGGGVFNCNATVINGQLSSNTPSNYFSGCPTGDCE
jgi:hypothetical protein